jgi:hypothetical protein
MQDILMPMMGNLQMKADNALGILTSPMTDLRLIELDEEVAWVCNYQANAGGCLKFTSKVELKHHEACRFSLGGDCRTSRKALSLRSRPNLSDTAATLAGFIAVLIAISVFLLQLILTNDVVWL